MTNATCAIGAIGAIQDCTYSTMRNEKAMTFATCAIGAISAVCTNCSCRKPSNGAGFRLVQSVQLHLLHTAQHLKMLCVCVHAREAAPIDCTRFFPRRKNDFA